MLIFACTVHQNHKCLNVFMSLPIVEQMRVFGKWIEIRDLKQGALI